MVLSHADRRWIDFITQEVNNTWDEANPGRPKTMGFRGSEEFIRLQFEEYLQALIASVKYQNYLTDNAHNPKAVLDHVEGDPSVDFGTEWVEAWKKTDNYRLWNTNTDSHLFDIVEPKHPCAGGLSIDDVQRRIQQQVQDLHLDETFAMGREVLGRNLAAGRDKASTVFGKLYSDMEAYREAQRKRAEEAKAKAAAAAESGEVTSPGRADTPKAQASVGARAGAYIGSWTSWADQKRKQGWGRTNSNASNKINTNVEGGSGGGGWGFSVRRSRNRDSMMSVTGDTPLGSPLSPSSPALSTREKFQMISLTGSNRGSESSDKNRPTTGDSYEESMLDAAGSDTESSKPTSPASSKQASRKIEDVVVSDKESTAAPTQKQEKTADPGTASGA